MVSSGNVQREAIISSKHSARDKALALASPYDGSAHDPFLHATGRMSLHSSLSEQPDDLTITFLFSATEIVERIAASEWTASQVLDAYMARAVVSQAKTNCITEGESKANGWLLSWMPIVRPSVLVLFKDAKNQAKDLDEEFSRTGKLRGPLHGVPMSFKDQCTYIYWLYCIHVLSVCADEIVGYDATIGFTHWANKPSVKDAFVSRLLVYMSFCCTYLPTKARHSVQKCGSHHYCENQRASDNVRVRMFECTLGPNHEPME